MHFKPKKLKPPTLVILKHSNLKLVSSHKYFGLEIGSKLDSALQWPSLIPDQNQSSGVSSLPLNYG